MEDWISVKESLPIIGQSVLVETLSGVHPALYDEREQFSRYPNYVNGDRSMSYYYPDVICWMPFPKPSQLTT